MINWKNRKYIAIAMLPVVVALISVAIIIPVGLIVTGSLSSVANSFALGTRGNTTRTNLFNNIYSAFDLTVIVPIVIGAVAVVSAILLLQGGHE